MGKLFARFYVSRSSHRLRQEADYRRDMLRGLSGRVLEVGCGHGLNFEFYPDKVTELVAIDPSDYMIAKAKERAWTVDTPIRVVQGTAERMDRLDLGYFDAVVFSLVLCSVDDPIRVLLKAQMVLNPGGQVRFYEHHIAADHWLAKRQRKIAPLWHRLMGGCHPDRDIVRMIGFHFLVTYTDEMWVPNGQPVFSEITAPHTVGHARLHHFR